MHEPRESGIASPAFRLTGEDVERYLKLRRQGLVEARTAFRSALADDLKLSDASWRQRLEHDFVVGVEVKGALAGIGGFARLTGAKVSHKGMIWGMYVAPEARGAGAADQIMAALIAHARTCVRQLHLTVSADNHRARAFYVRHGFSDYGVEPQALLDEGVFLDEALMWRLLA